MISVIVGLIFFPSAAIKTPDTTYTKHYFAVRGLVPLMNPTTIGSISALLLISTFSSTLVSKLHTRQKNNIGIWVVAGLAITDLLMAHSRTPVIACAIVIMGILYFAKKTKQMIIAGSIGALILIATEGINFILSYIYRGQTAESFSSLTGRLGFWERHIFGLIADSPIIGHGYYAGFREVVNVGSIDNAFLAVTVGVGLVGLIIFLIPIIYIIANLLRSRPRKREITERDSFWFIIFGFIGIILMRSMTGTSFEVMHPLLVVYMTLQLGIAAIIRLDHSNITDKEHENKNTNDVAAIDKPRTLEKTPPKLLHLTNRKK